MTKEITKAIIIQQMVDKFGLRALESEIFRLSEQVIPIYNIEQHLQTWKTEYLISTVASTGAKLLYVVPDDEIWYLSGYDVVFMAAGAYTVSGVYISRKSSIAVFHYLDLTAGQTISYSKDLPKLETLQAGDRIYINVDGYTSTADLRLYINYMMEKIR